MFDLFNKKKKRILELEKELSVCSSRIKTKDSIISSQGKELAKRKVPFFKEAKILIILYGAPENPEKNINYGVLNVGLSLKHLFVTKTITKTHLQQFKENPEILCQEFLDKVKPKMLAEIPKLLEEFQ